MSSIAQLYRSHEREFSEFTPICDYEPVGRYGYRVALQDGADVHLVAVALDGDEHVDSCDCRGFIKARGGVVAVRSREGSGPDGGA